MSDVAESSYLCLELNSGSAQGWSLISKSWTTATPSTPLSKRRLHEYIGCDAGVYDLGVAAGSL